MRTAKVYVSSHQSSSIRLPHGERNRMRHREAALRALSHEHSLSRRLSAAPLQITPGTVAQRERDDNLRTTIACAVYSGAIALFVYLWLDSR